MPDIVNIVIGTAGHIDHGKSTLVRALTGIDPDRLPEEKERGLTIDLGFAPFVLKDGRRLGLIDVPGHEKFVKNMVAGATSLDGVMLVVAADDGIMPQTREHLNILQLLNVRRGFVVLTKIDIAGPEMTELVEDDIRNLVRGTFLEGMPIFRVNSATRDGFPALIDGLNRLATTIPPRAVDGIFRMPIQRVFSARGFGTIATGVPVSGRAATGDTLEVLPLGKSSRIRGLQAYKADVEEIRAGHSSAVNLPDIDHADVVRGMVLATPGYLRALDHINARFRPVPAALGMIRHLADIRFHAGTSESLGVLNLLEGATPAAGAEALIQVRLHDPIVVAPGDLFLIRLQSPMVVLGGGRILGGSLGRPKGNRAKVLEELRAAELAVGDPRTRLAHVLRCRGASPIGVEAAAREALLPLAQGFSLVGGLKQKGEAVELASGRFVHKDGLAAAVQSVVAVIEEHHRTNPVSVGLERIPLRAASRLEPEVFDAALASARETGRLEEERGIWRRTTHAVELDPAQAKLVEAARKLLLEDRFSTPRTDEMSSRLGKTPQQVDKLIKLMIQTGEVVRLRDDLLLHRDAIAEAAARVRQFCLEKGEVSPGDVRDLLQTTRKYALPLLEHLDAIGVTVRVGDKRVAKP